MAIEKERGEQTPNPDFTIIGQGNIGEKARQLVEKMPALKEIGFAVPHRTILAEDFFDPFFQRNGIAASLREVEADPRVAEAIIRGSFPQENFAVLNKIRQAYGSSPLMVRSSAEGDARGTGTYVSSFSDNHPGMLRKNVQRVLASYFSKSAIAFRRDAQTGEGFGIIVEPLIGQTHVRKYEFGGQNAFFAPMLSGFGYTSTLKGEGYVSVVPGLGGGVDTREGMKITKANLQPHDGDIILSIIDPKMSRRYGYFDTRDKPLLLQDGTPGKTYIPPDKYQITGSLHEQDMDLHKRDGLIRTDMRPLFDMMSGMEDEFGKPQYFEWAMTLENKKPTYHILQIADVDKKIDQIDFERHGIPIFTAQNVTGSGIVDVEKIALCMDTQDIKNLRRFNQKNRGYALLYSSNLTTRMEEQSIRLRYGDFSNAKVFLEYPAAGHDKSPVAHLMGQFELTDKIFGVLEFDSKTPPDFKEFEIVIGENEGIRVYPEKLKVVASEKHDQLVVYKKENPID